MSRPPSPTQRRDAGLARARPARLPAAITSYDLLKTFAMLTMVVDHVGVYLFPDQIGWRILGRMSLPVWLFLVGFARSRDLGPALFAGALITLLGNLVFGQHLLPANILFTIIVTRLLIDGIMRRALASRPAFLGEVLLLVLLAPTLVLFEYGSHAFLWAMAGYLSRHRDRVGASAPAVLGFLAFVGLVHATTQAYLLETDPPQSLAIGLGVLAVAVVLAGFRPATYPRLTRRLAPLLVGTIHLLGRQSLALYVGHLLLLQAMAAVLVWEHDWLLQWRWLLFRV